MEEKIKSIVNKLKEYCFEYPNEDCFYFMVDKTKILISDILREEDYLKTIKEVYNNLNSEEKRDFLTLIYNSDMEIFNEWFYNCLKNSLDSKEKDTDYYFAKDLYDTYKGHWEKLERKMKK